MSLIKIISFSLLFISFAADAKPLYPGESAADRNYAKEQSDEVFNYINNLPGRNSGEVRTYMRKGRIFYQIEGDSAEEIVSDLDSIKKKIGDFEGFPHYRYGAFHCVKISYFFDSETFCQVTIHRNHKLSHEAFCREPICNE